MVQANSTGKVVASGSLRGGCQLVFAFVRIVVVNAEWILYGYVYVVDGE